MPRFSEILSRSGHDDSSRDPIDRSRRALIGAGGALMLGAALWPLRARAATDGKLKIGVIGSGNIGGTIGGLWVKAGHPVLFSSRHPEELKGLVESLGPLAKAGTVAEADRVRRRRLYRGALRRAAAGRPGIRRRAQGQDRHRRLQCRAARATAPSPRRSSKNGIGVTSQKYLPGARIVRAFNSLNFRIFAQQANRPDPKLAIPIAGDEAEALKVAAGLVRDAGFDPVVVGKLADASRFQMGAPGFGQQVTAAELRQKLSLKP